MEALWHETQRLRRTLNPLPLLQLPQRVPEELIVHASTSAVIVTHLVCHIHTVYLDHFLQKHWYIRYFYQTCCSDSTGEDKDMLTMEKLPLPNNHPENSSSPWIWMRSPWHGLTLILMLVPSQPSIPVLFVSHWQLLPWEWTGNLNNTYPGGHGVMVTK